MAVREQTPRIVNGPLLVVIELVEDTSRVTLVVIRLRSRTTNDWPGAVVSPNACVEDSSEVVTNRESALDDPASSSLERWKPCHGASERLGTESQQRDTMLRQ